MADPVHRLSCGDEHFDLAGLMSDEMAHVKSWTQLKNRRDFYQALQDEDPDAVTAAFTLARRRDGNPNCRFSEVKVNLDDLIWSRHIDGRKVEVSYDAADDGSPLQVLLDDRFRPLRNSDGGYLLPTGEEGERVGPAVLFDGDEIRWRYTDTGEDVNPTVQPATSGSTGSPTTATKRRGGGSDSGTPTINES